MSDGTEFQVCGAATENARRASSLRVLGTFSSGASDDRRGRTGTAVLSAELGTQVFFALTHWKRRDADSLQRFDAIANWILDIGPSLQSELLISNIPKLTMSRLRRRS